MARDWTTPMEWQNAGIEPSTELKQTGYAGKDKPAAPTFNFFLHNQQMCVQELQTAIDENETLIDDIQTEAEETAKTIGNIGTVSQQHINRKISETTAGGAHGLRIKDGELQYLNDENVWVAVPKVGKGLNDNAEIFNDYINNVATGSYAHAQNQNNTASGGNSDAGGLATVASGEGSFTRGFLSEAGGVYTNALGFGVVSSGEGQTVLGKYNKTNEDAYLIVGCGTDEETTANALRVSTAGRCYGSSSFLASGADYAEMFEWYDGNPNNEDRRGLFVTLDGEKIKLANSSEDYILGVVSSVPSMVGDTFSEDWHRKYKKDVFGADIWEYVEVEEKIVKDIVIPAHIEKRRVLNPEYDATQKYTSRDERKEWTAVGLIGKLIMIDDGTCEVNGYCTVRKNGVATKADDKTAYRVMSRIDDTHIRILIK